MKTKNPILTDFSILRPTYIHEQLSLAATISAAHTQADPGVSQRITKLFTRFGCKPNQIAYRGTDIPDILAPEFADSDIHGRNLFFSKIADDMFKKFYTPAKAKKEQPDHLIHVTCTGYVSPSAAQKFVAGRGWSKETDVTHAYQMGCYASIPSVRMAKGFLSSGQAKVDIVHTELCTLHLNPLDHSPEQIVVQSLFADGHIKYSLKNPGPDVTPGFELMETQEWIVPDTSDAMTWIPTSWGMKMTLSRDVPEKIAENLKPFLESILTKAEVGGVPSMKDAVFAIHPGGPKIIDSIAGLLELSDKQIEHSRGVLHDFGNMSSATLPHVWSRILDDASIPSGQLVISLAFGPGLTIFGAVMRKQ